MKVQLVVLAAIASLCSGGIVYDKDVLGRYMCGPNYVLVVYKQEDNAVHMYCDQIDVCGQKLTCTYTTSACPNPMPDKLGFLAGVLEYTKFGTLSKRCCNYGPKPDDYDSTECTTIDIVDKTQKVDEGSSGGSVPDNKVTPPSGGGGGGAPSGGGGEPSQTGEGDQQTIKDPAEVFKNELQSAPVPLSIVADIARISNGYRVTLCEIRCEQTTTTKRPTTKKPKGSNEDDEANVGPPEEDENEGPYDPNSGGNAPPEPEDKPLPLGCFSGDTVVETPAGPKSMDQLLPNDQVLVATPEGGAFEPVEFWYHRLPEESADYVTIRTESERTLSLSKAHLIPLYDCDDQLRHDDIERRAGWEARFAQRATPGQCVGVLDQGRLRLDKIKTVHIEQKQGVYSPITSSGMIVTGGIQASCYTTYEYHPAAHGMHRMLMLFYKLIGHDVQLVDVPIPKPIDLLRHLANLVAPENTFKY